MKPAQWTVPVVLLALVVAGEATAQEKRLKKSELPSAVQKTVAEVSHGARIRGYSSEVEGGQLQYEVAMTVNGCARDVSIAPDGRVLEVEDEIALSALPDAVRGALEKQAAGGTITKVESLTKHGAIVAYEAHVRTDTKRTEIQVGPDGQPLAHEE